MKYIEGLFIADSIKVRETHPLEGVSYYTLKSGLNHIGKQVEKGITHFLLFGATDDKSISKAANENGLISTFIQKVKDIFGTSVTIHADVGISPYTQNGESVLYTHKKIDEKLLVELIRNSRQPITQLAKKTRISRDIAQYRIFQLVKKGVIRDFITNIDHEKLGFLSALFFISIKSSVEKEFITYVNTLPFISWSGTQLGKWSIGMAIYGKSVQEIEEKFNQLFFKYKDAILDHQFEFYKTTKFFPEKYFGQTNVMIDSKKIVPYKLDTHDKTILKMMSKNARISSMEMTKEVSLTATAIAQRIKKLENGGYIRGYSIFLNLFKLNIYLFIFFIKNKTLEQRTALSSYLETHPKVSLLLDYVGDPFVEFSLFAKDPYEIRSVLQKIKERFPDNELVDFFLVQDEFISFGVPKCVFE